MTDPATGRRTADLAAGRGEGSPAGRRAVVLGASGFLGRHICAALAAAGAQVVRVSRGGHDGPVDPGHRSVRLDLAGAGPGEIARLCAGADVLVNASGMVWGGTERQMAEVNADLVARLVQVAAGLPGRPRFVQLGSAYEYGPVGHGAMIGEGRRPAPTTAYARTKLLGSQAVVRAAAEGRLDGVVLRVSVACGPGAPRVSLPGIVAGHLAAGRAELRLSPLRAHRDLVDVRDVADAVVAAARAPARALTEGIVNIGRGEAVHVRALVDLMISLSGLPVRIVEEPVAGTPRSDGEWQRLDIGRARRLLGWSPRRSVEESMRDLLATVGVPCTRPGPAPRPGPRGRQDSEAGPGPYGRATVQTAAPVQAAGPVQDGQGKDRR